MSRSPGLRHLILLKLSPLLIFAACDGVSTSPYGAPEGGVEQAFSQDREFAIAAESASQDCLPPPSGLIAWYTGDSDGTDRRGDPAGALVGGASIGQGQIGNAFQFNGQNSGVQIPSNAKVDFAAGEDFTIELWVSVQSTVASREYLGLVDKHDPTGRGYSFFLRRPDQIGLQLANSSQDFDNHFSLAPLVRDGGLHHVAVVVDHIVGVRFYVDGIPTEAAAQPLKKATNPANDAPLFLGRSPSTTSASLAGRLDEVSVYNRPVSPTDIANIYQAGAAGKCKVTITPVDGPNTITAGDTKPYTATVSGARDTSIIWTATGGTIDDNGNWTAPSTPGTYTLTAAAHADPYVLERLEVTVEAAPARVTFTADPTTVLYGGSSTLQWTTAGAVQAAITPSLGSVTPLSGGSVSTGALTATTTYTLTATNASGASVTEQVTVRVGSVSVSAVSPANSTVTVGTSTTFAASVSGAVDANLRWSATCGTITSGGAWMAPASPATCTITATSNADPTKSNSTTVTVVAAPVISSFTSNPPMIPYGGSSSLQWVTAGATQTTIAPALGSVTPVSGGSVSTGALTATATYTLTATNAAGASVTAQVTVSVASVSVSAVSPANSTVTVGASTTFTASVSSAVDATLRWSASCGTITSGGVWMAPAAPGTCTITATSNADPTKSSSTTVTVVAAPVISSFTATPSMIPYGGSSSLQWVTTGAVQTTIAPAPGSVTPVSGGSVSTGALTATATYTLTATNAAGASVTAQVTVSVGSVSVSAVSPANSTVTVGTNTTFTASVSGAVDASLRWAASCGTINGSGRWTAPTSPGTCTITATSNADPTKSSGTTVTVVAAPVITSFTANPSSIPYGSSTTLQWATTGATQTTIAPAPGSVAPPSGGSVSTGALTTTTTYTLTATNAAGARVTATVRINVSLLCAAGLADCNGNTADGCETSYLSDSQNCGACGNRCASGMSCYGGQCAESCDAPQLPAPFPGCVNVASLAQASASSIFTDPPYGPPSAAFDGNQCTYWNAGVHAPAWIQASFAQPTTLRAFVMVPEATPNSDVHHVIESSDDGVTFTTRLEIYDYHEDRKVYTYALPAPVTARYWRVSSLSSESWIAWADIGMYSCP